MSATTSSTRRPSTAAGWWPVHCRGTRWRPRWRSDPERFVPAPAPPHVSFAGRIVGRDPDAAGRSTSSARCHWAPRICCSACSCAPRTNWVIPGWACWWATHGRTRRPSGLAAGCERPAELWRRSARARPAPNRCRSRRHAGYHSTENSAGPWTSWGGCCSSWRSDSGWCSRYCHFRWPRLSDCWHSSPRWPGTRRTGHPLRRAANPARVQIKYKIGYIWILDRIIRGVT